MIAVWLLASCGSSPLPIRATTGACSWTGAVCHLAPDADLVIWLPERGAARVRIAGQDQGVTVEPVDQGIRLTVAAPVPHGSLSIALTRGQERWTDRFEIAPSPPPSDIVHAASEAFAKGPQCEATIASLLETAAPDDRGHLLEWWASCNRQHGDGAAYGERIEAAAAEHTAAGRSSLAVACIGARIQVAHNDAGLFERLLRDADPGRDGNAAWTLHHTRARVHESRGEVRRAEYEDAMALAIAVQNALHVRKWRSQNARAARAAALGDAQGAVAILEQHPPTAKDPSHQLILDWHREKNALWYRMDALQTEGTPIEEISAVRDRLDALGSRTHAAAVAPSSVANLHIDRARAALLAGDDAGMQLALEEARAMPGTLGPAADQWAREIEARLALRAGDLDEAREIWTRALGDARAGGEGHHRIRSLLGLASTAIAAEDTEAATHAFDDARASIASMGQRLPFDLQRGPWFDAHATVIGEQLHFLDETHGAAAAMDALRRAYSERLSTLDHVARSTALPHGAQDRWTVLVDDYHRIRNQITDLDTQRWQLPGDEIPAASARHKILEDEARDMLAALLAVHAPRAAPLPDLHEEELTLAWWPHGDRLLAFAAYGGEVRGEVLPRGATDSEALEPFESWIRRARRIRLLPHGRLVTRDLHVAVVGGKPLIAWAPVVWSLDLRPRSGKTEAGRSIVVGDPRGDLPHARSEAERVAKAWGVRPLIGDRATQAEVANQLATAARAHIATHATTGSGAGSGLQVADGELRIGDVLALPAVPEQVFLSGCETGTSTYGLGLAQAFVLAGSSSVVASTRPVSDILTDRLVTAWDADDSSTAAARLARAQLALHHTDPDADWSAWRVWTR